MYRSDIRMYVNTSLLKRLGRGLQVVSRVLIFSAT